MILKHTFDNAFLFCPFLCQKDGLHHFVKLFFTFNYNVPQGIFARSQMKLALGGFLCPTAARRYLMGSFRSKPHFHQAPIASIFFELYLDMEFDNPVNTNLEADEILCFLPENLEGLPKRWTYLAWFKLQLEG